MAIENPHLHNDCVDFDRAGECIECALYEAYAKVRADAVREMRPYLDMAACDNCTPESRRANSCCSALQMAADALEAQGAPPTKGGDHG
jgi:hypothetical protein